MQVGANWKLHFQSNKVHLKNRYSNMVKIKQWLEFYNVVLRVVLAILDNSNTNIYKKFMQNFSRFGIFHYIIHSWC